MTLRDQVMAQSLVLAGELEAHQQEVLGALCSASTAVLQARLREGIHPEDCRADFIAAASLMALASLNAVGEDQEVEQISVGDFSIRKGRGDAASNCLRVQAELLIAPYLKDRFSFRGV